MLLGDLAPNSQSFTFSVVKINKEKPYLKWNWEARRENSHEHATQGTLDPNRKRGTQHLQWEVTPLTTPAERRGKFPLAQQQLSQRHTAVLSQQKATICTSYSQSPPMDSSFIIAPPNFVKRHSPPCSSGLHVLNCNSSLFLNKLILLVK